MRYRADIGIILRDDELIQKYNLKQIEVETDYGICKRVYVGRIGNNNIAMLYGRFEGIRTPSWEINYKQNQMVFSKLGVKTIIGTFIVGSVSSIHRAGDIFVPDNFVGFNSYYENLIVDRPFKNVDVYEPFCSNIRKELMLSAEKINIQIKEGVYLSFTGLPRIETKAELNLYEKLGLDIVGQTLDPEVTLARQMGCHYAAICALTDDVTIRKMFSNRPEESRKINNNFIISGRKKMAKIIELMLVSTHFDEVSGCACEYKFTDEENFFSNKPLYNVDKRLMYERNIMKKKWNIGWGISSACNMNCQFCYSKEVREKSSDLGYDDWVKFIDENYERIESINYGTGENTLYDDWFKFIDYVYLNYGIEQALTTNGFVSQRMKDNKEFEEIIRRSISEVDISLDFCDPDKHNEFRGQAKAYEWVMDMLEFCKENEKRTTIVFIGTNETMNQENLKGLFEIAKKYNAKLRMNIYRPTNGINEHSKRFIASYENIIDTLKFVSDNYKILALSDSLFSAILTDNLDVSDPSGQDSLRILPDGSITPSTYLITEKFRKYNIKTKNVLENLFFDNEEFDRSIPDDCKNCEWKNSCRGGIFDRRYLWYNKFNERDPYCPRREENYIPDKKVKVIKTRDFTSIHDGYLPTIFFAN